MTGMMKAAVIHAPGGPEVLKLESIPIPTPSQDHVLIQVKAFGLNRSELFTRQGHSPGVNFPRVLGIEAVGIVAESPGGQFTNGQKVMTCMGGLGRDFDGGYAEYTCPPANQVLAIESEASWEQVGSSVEMLQTTWGSLFTALRLQKGEHLLIRGGTSSIGLAAASIASSLGAYVSSTTRSMTKEAILKASGVDEIFIDSGEIAKDVRAKYPEGVDKVLELIGTTSIKDSLKCVKTGGAACMTGILGGSWTISDFSPMEFIPHAVNLTVYSGGIDDFKKTPYSDLMKQVEAGTLNLSIGKVFHLDEIVEATQCMEDNKAGGKIVVLT